MNAIESRQNETFKELLSLTNSRGLKKSKLFLLSGEKLVSEVVRLKPEIIEAILSSKKHRLKTSFENFRNFKFSNELFESLDVLGTKSPILLCSQATFKSWKPNISSGLTVLLPLGDPKNLGAAIRSATAFDADQIVLLEESANPYLPQTLKSSSGAVLTAGLVNGPSIGSIEGLKIKIHALDMNGTDIGSYKWPKDVVLLIGEEGPGVKLSSQNLEKLSIKTSSRVESLNAVVAESIALFSYRLSHPL